MITACECMCAFVCTFVCMHTGIAFTAPSLAMHPPPCRCPPLTMPHTRGDRLHNPFFILNLYFVWIFFSRSQTRAGCMSPRPLSGGRGLSAVPTLINKHGPDPSANKLPISPPAQTTF